MTIDVAPVTFRAFALKRGQREDIVNGRRYRTSTDHSGRTVIGPVRHRAGKGMIMEGVDSPEAKALTGLGKAFSPIWFPAPPPQKRGRWQRIKDGFAYAWDRFTDPEWHKAGQHMALNLFMWALAAGAVGLVARVLLWAWS